MNGAQSPTRSDPRAVYLTSAPAYGRVAGQRRGILRRGGQGAGSPVASPPRSGRSGAVGPPSGGSTPVRPERRHRNPRRPPTARRRRPGVPEGWQDPDGGTRPACSRRRCSGSGSGNSARRGDVADRRHLGAEPGWPSGYPPRLDAVARTGVCSASFCRQRRQPDQPSVCASVFSAAGVVGVPEPVLGPRPWEGAIFSPPVRPAPGRRTAPAGPATTACPGRPGQQPILRGSGAAGVALTGPVSQPPTRHPLLGQSRHERCRCTQTPRSPLMEPGDGASSGVNGGLCHGCGPLVGRVADKEAVTALPSTPCASWSTRSPCAAWSSSARARRTTRRCSYNGEEVGKRRRPTW